MDETTLTADLPNLRLTMCHRAAEDGNGESITLHLEARTDLTSALPLAAAFAQSSHVLGTLSSPWDLWLRLHQSMIDIWTRLAREMIVGNPENDVFLVKFKK